MSKYELINECLEDMDTYDFVELWNEYADTNSADKVYLMDDFDDEMYNFAPSEIIERCSGVHSGDDFFKDDGWGNYYSFCDPQYECDTDNLIDWIIECADVGGDDADFSDYPDLQSVIDKLDDEEE